MENIEGQVYENPETGDEMSVYKQDGKWIGESNRFDTEEKTKERLMQKIKFWGYTEFVGYMHL